MSAVAARPSAFASWWRGVQLGASRLRWGAVLGIALLSIAVAGVGGLTLHASAPLEAPGRALGVVLRWVVPLATFALCSLCIGRCRLQDSVWPLAAHGIPRRQVVLGLVSLTMGVSALLAGAVALLAMTLAYGKMPGLGADLVTSVWISALGGAAYAAWFTYGASFMRLGRGRWAPLIADFILGATSGVFAVIWPRPHLASLSGGEPLLEIAQATSSVVLAAMTFTVVCLAAMRAGD